MLFLRSDAGAAGMIEGKQIVQHAVVDGHVGAQRTVVRRFSQERPSENGEEKLRMETHFRSEGMQRGIGGVRGEECKFFFFCEVRRIMQKNMPVIAYDASCGGVVLFDEAHQPGMLACGIGSWYRNEAVFCLRSKKCGVHISN